MFSSRIITYLYIAIISILIGMGIFYTKSRWINADEGAHLSDVQLVSEGYVPFVDFESREPAYVYLLFAGTKIFGRSIFHVRLLPFIFFIINGFLIFYLGKIVFDKTIGLISNLIYWFTPFLLIYSPLIKTENFAIFFTLLAFIFLYKYFQSNKIIFSLLSGIFSVIAYFSRLADIATFASIVLIYIFACIMERGRIKGLLYYLLAYWGSATIVLSIFTRKGAFYKIFFSSLNPMFLFITNLGKVIPAFSKSEFDFKELPAVKQNVARTVLEINRVADMNLFLLLAFGIAFSIFIYWIVKNRNHRMWGNLVLMVWGSVFMLFYGYYAWQRGFYGQYFTEIVPPLIITFAYIVTLVYKNIEEWLPIWLFSLMPTCFFLLYILFNFFDFPYPNRFIFLILSSFIVMLVILLRQSKFTKDTLLGVFSFLGTISLFILIQKTNNFMQLPKKFLLFVDLLFLFFSLFSLVRSTPQFSYRRLFYLLSFIILFTGTTIGGATSGIFLKPFRYDCTWSPKAVKKVSKILTKYSSPCRVLSGGMIWSYEAKKEPFMGITHPLKYNAGFPLEIKKRIENNFKNNPPRYIIVDGYLKRNFAKYIPLIQQALLRDYRKIAVIQNVLVYQHINISQL